ncbi:MAG: PBP1A family penicillin-binding protein [Patescibacteria group bacterium]
MPLRKKLGLEKKIVRRSLVIAGIVILFSLGSLLFWAASFKIPSLDSFEERRVDQSTKIYDKTGKVLLYDVFENVKRTVVALSEISPNVVRATIAIEDKDFYTHSGVQPTALLRAILVNFQTGEFSQGGSTITQQVIKNSILTKEKSVARKLKEWILALKLEQELSKDAILSMYLNEIPYGGSVYGIEKASEVFFGKHASELTIAESAYMAALPQAPTYYSPYGQHRDELEKRKNLVLSQMLSVGFIKEEEYESAKKEQVAFLPQEGKGIKAPHFVLFVKEYLEETYGKDLVESGGLTVITTLDYEMQKKGEEIVEKYALENKEKFNAENAALVAVDPKTGGILTMVGSRNYFDKEIDGNYNVATAHTRQPGSAFKPFAYAAAFMRGFTPETTLFDLKTEFSGYCDAEGNTINPLQNKDDVCYMPENYDNIFRGPITMREALAQSINVPSVKTMYLAGMDKTLRLTRDMGVTSLTDIGRYGLTLVLGGGEVSLLDMTSAYGVFANEGLRNPYTAILEVRQRNGIVLEKITPRAQQVIPAEITRNISDILSDNAARAPAFGENSFLYFPNREVAVKTGTTNDYKDAWIIGYTPSVSVGAWAGNNDYTSMEKKVAGFIIAPLWNAFMKEILPLIPEERFNRPIEEELSLTELKPVLRGKWQGGISFPIDRISQKRATEYTPKETLDEILVGGVHDILYWVNKDDPRGLQPPSPQNDPQFERWEYQVRTWVETQHITETTESSVPQLFDNIHMPSTFPMVTIESPGGRPYSANEKITILFSYSGTYPIARAEYFLNGVYVGENNSSPYSISFTPQEISEARGGENELKVIVQDSVFNRKESVVKFIVLY